MELLKYFHKHNNKGSHKVISPVLCQSTWTYASIMLCGPLATNISENLYHSRTITSLLNWEKRHGFYCPGSLYDQDISSHDIEYIEYVGILLLKSQRPCEAYICQ